MLQTYRARGGSFITAPEKNIFRRLKQEMYADDLAQDKLAAKDSKRVASEWSSSVKVMRERQMSNPAAMGTEQVDSLLLPFVRATDNADQERLLSQLITEHADPIITKIVNYKMYSGRRADTLGDAEDIRSEVMLQLIQRLQTFRADYAARPIGNFNSYVAVTTYNACDRYVSRKYPQRRRLKNGLRYLLTHREGFALWQDAGHTWLGGLSSWRPTGRAGETFGNDAISDAESGAHRLQLLRDDPQALASDGAAQASWSDQKRPYELLSAIFAWAGAPVELDLLTSICAEWWDVSDKAVEIDAGSNVEGGEEAAAGVQIADQRPAVSVETERRIYLERLWNEITELPARQRAALLLNLRDEGGRGIVDLWIIARLATPEAIAEALSLTLKEFAELWSELPLDDNRIAALLGITRQQVINLRKSARERLARRVKD
ncbi:MAG: sigma-70 family RNA polymerase sigma factor, partial [Pyrinomonadaceae bacterium]|nr:sigma-70 family RNA polymerase sigma factor [Pyrinomonadaceae bacterium]